MSEASNLILSRLLESRTGQSLSLSRQWRISSVLAGLMRDRGIANIDELAAAITKSRDSRLETEVVDALLNNETYFFRDQLPFDLVEQKILPLLAKNRADSKRISIWSAGCSTGQEALSLALLFAERKAMWADWTIEIVATDVSETAVKAAREACFSQFHIQRGLSMMHLVKWFDDTAQGWRAKDELRGMIRYQVHNILDAPPIKRAFDIVLCRNVLLYFSDENRRRAMDRIAQAMSPDGRLLLGASETLVGGAVQFETDPQNPAIHRRVSADALPKIGWKSHDTLPTV